MKREEYGPGMGGVRSVRENMQAARGKRQVSRPAPSMKNSMRETRKRKTGSKLTVGPKTKSQREAMMALADADGATKMMAARRM